MSERLRELAARLVAPGPKASHVSASETHEISEGLISALNEQDELTRVYDRVFEAGQFDADRSASEKVMAIIKERDAALQRELARPHWADCAVNHGGSACDMGPECGLPPEERALVLNVERRIATWLETVRDSTSVWANCPVGWRKDVADAIRRGAWRNAC